MKPNEIFTFNKETGIIEGLTCSKNLTGDIIIPEEIDGIPVTTIGADAFAEYGLIKTISIPDTVTTIGKHAFSGCKSLESMYIPKNVYMIDQFTFAGCHSLKTITISKNIGVIRRLAFYACTSLSNVYYEGSEEDWNGIIIDPGNDDLTLCMRHYYQSKLK